MITIQISVVTVLAILAVVVFNDLLLPIICWTLAGALVIGLVALGIYVPMVGLFMAAIAAMAAAAFLLP